MKIKRTSALLLVAMIEGDGGSGGGKPADSPADPPNGGTGDDGKPADKPDDKPADPPNGGTGDDGKPADKTGDDDTDWKSRSRTWENRAKDHKTAAEKATAERDAANERMKAVLKAAGYDVDDQDPAKLAEQAKADATKNAAERDAERRERAAERHAYRNGVDVDALMDSRGFAAQLDKLDPSTESFADDVAALIDKQVEARPSLKAAATTSTKPPPSADMSGGGEPAKDGPPTVEELRKKRAQGQRSR